jgi:deoxyribodipyrimidine photo-lyase
MTRAIVWFRRDLRLHDHPALTAALAEADEVIPLFVFDDALLRGRWPAANRVWFMRESLSSLADAIRERGGRLRFARGRPAAVIPDVVRELQVDGVYITRDASPYGRRRDQEVARALAGTGVTVHAKRGLYVHEPDELCTSDGSPFSVYSPYRRAWQARPRRLVIDGPPRIPTPDRLRAERSATDLPSLPDLGIDGPTADRRHLLEPGEDAARRRLDHWLQQGVADYARTRDRLVDGSTSRLSQDLRWGLLSPLEVVDRAAGPGQGRRVFVQELIWREFYAHVLWHHPDVLVHPFRREFERVRWRTDDDAVDAIEAWKAGRTGYPIVDAAMRQLAAAGFMPNRARMVVASFLSKDLLVDWRIGERHFMEHLVDGDVASNDGGWQWTASTGTDPQPYFRIFNPVLQSRRADPDGSYLRQWLPELRHVPTSHIHEPWTMSPELQAQTHCRIGRDYPAPVVDHAEARARALAAYAAARG